MPLSVWTLVVAQSLAMCTAPFIVFIGSLQGLALAPSPGFATLPVALVVVGTVFAVRPVTGLMATWGRKPVMLLGALVGAFAAGLGALASKQESFFLVCAAAFIGGMALAVVHQYRFAAMEAVPEALAGSAAARVLLGGMVAAWLGPELAVLGYSGDGDSFITGWLALAGVQLLAAVVVMVGFHDGGKVSGSGSSTGGRPLGEILLQPVIWVAVSSAAIGYGLMSFIMTATPLSMTEMAGHGVEDAKLVIQLHILAMYLPSLVSGWLTRRLGLAWMMVWGLASYLACVVIATSGVSFAHFVSALILLGVGWNLLFVAGTTLLPQAYQAEERFRVQGMNDLLIFGVQAVAALSAGSVLSGLGWQGVVYLAIPFLIVHGLIMVLWRMRTSPAPVR
ncbi:MFS transporter [Marinobacter zhejiangensis]|uniref:Predicted arabinose efflux permease, MFS family n=1 Tax=Marinobacter zhejiangensis TaxID=488535 RepID=A0A1I4PCH7_9GAMM|nr:MFS transporter [Marinobacter zhejiangensis]SFM25295.1 Predicted arabinose efflux permease, MFS family [Marinobacter zhejiangensis]